MGSDDEEMDIAGNGVPRSNDAALMMDTVVHSRDSHLTVASADIAAVMLQFNHVKSTSIQSNETDDFISNGEMEEEEDDDGDTSIDTMVRMDDDDDDTSIDDGNSTIVSMEEARRMNSTASLNPIAPMKAGNELASIEQQFRDLLKAEPTTSFSPELCAMDSAAALSTRSDSVEAELAALRR